MRLLNVESSELELEEFFGDNIPPYAILSHTWEKDEVLFQDLERRNYKHKLGYKKIRFTCEQARKDGLHWCWVDTCCIDKSSSAELSEAINSMFNWYWRAQVCYTYLTDVDFKTLVAALEAEPPNINETTTNATLAGIQHESRSESGVLNTLPSEPSLGASTGSSLQKRTPEAVTVAKAVRNSRWFGRGWTLQELIAPRSLRFYDLDWHHLGNRDEELSEIVCERTGLDGFILGKPEYLHSIPIARRISWMARRLTTRKEDESYCMLGILGVNMPLLYGEEGKAFVRLQEELIKRSCDHSLLIFRVPAPDFPVARRILADAPRNFYRCKDIKKSAKFDLLFPLQSYRLANDGLHIILPLIRGERISSPMDFALLGYSHQDSRLGYSHGDSLIGLTLARTPHAWYVREYLSTPMTALPWLGTGVVSIPQEVAATATQEMILIVDGYRSMMRSCLSAKNDAWLRYDLALRPTFSTAQIDLAQTIARQQEKRLPHMIRLRAQPQDSSEQSACIVLNFRLQAAEPLDVLVVLASRPWDVMQELKGAVFCIDDPMIETKEQLFAEKAFKETKQQVMAFGTNLINSRHSFRDAGLKSELASTYLKEFGMLKLVHDGSIGALQRVTLRFEHAAHEGFLSDGTKASESCKVNDDAAVYASSSNLDFT